MDVTGGEDLESECREGPAVAEAVADPNPAFSVQVQLLPLAVVFGE